jgi:hypothetical protein
MLVQQRNQYLAEHAKLIFYTMSAEVIHSPLVAVLKLA